MNALLRSTTFLRAITVLVYLVEAHHHLNPIFILKHDSPRRIDNGVVMLVLKARGIPLRFGKVQLSLVALNPKLEVFYALSNYQMSGPLVDGRSENLVFRWEICVDQCRIVVFGTTGERYHTLQQYRICTPLQSRTDLAPFVLAQHQGSTPPSSSRWTVQELVAFFHLALKMNHFMMKDLNDFKSRAFQVLRFKLSNISSLAEPVYKYGNVTGLREKRVFRRR
nr:hypothetical protein [Tanacetum cinerariifolium]